MVSGKCPTLPSLKLGLESRLGLGLYLSLWEMWVGGLPETRMVPICGSVVAYRDRF